MPFQVNGLSVIVTSFHLLPHLITVRLRIYDSKLTIPNKSLLNMTVCCDAISYVFETMNNTLVKLVKTHQKLQMCSKIAN